MREIKEKVLVTKAESDRKYKLKNLEEERRKDREYYYKNKDKINKRITEKRRNDSEARHKSKVRVQTSLIPYKRCCEICGSEEKLFHHHFTNPYDKDFFIDLCKECHLKVDRYDKLTQYKIKSFHLAEVEKVIYKLKCHCDICKGKSIHVGKGNLIDGYILEQKLSEGKK